MTQFLKLSQTSETVCQDSNLLVDTSLVDIPYTIVDTSTCAVSVTESCTLSFYVFCLSVLIKLVVVGTLIHEMLLLKVLNDTIEYWISSSDLPQNINIHGANTAVKFAFF